VPDNAIIGGSSVASSGESMLDTVEGGMVESEETPLVPTMEVS